MSTGSVSDNDDIHEMMIQDFGLQFGASARTCTDTVAFHSPENSEDESCAEFCVGGGRGKGGQSGSLRCQVPKGHRDCKQSQRNAANARERARMRVLSKAFTRLKTSLPWVPPDTKLSKLDTLRLASSYIAHLRQLLQEDTYGNGFVHPVSLTWPFIVSGRPDTENKDVSSTTRLCGATA
ncbi:transcription factor 21 [Erpetoichthys calabaricus]|uniref:Musculin n=1 Tax=Erpetoichthys calabaricus TaxID=27687 RepID=A0A8C4RYZ2_ERPCA|nr:transcription factor 21 [Erpetoichthys calabaricus]